MTNGEIIHVLLNCHRYVFVGDVVMLKDPQNEKQELVRRVAAIEGEEMVSSKDEDEPFQLDPGMCWVLCDNESINAKVRIVLFTLKGQGVCLYGIRDDLYQSQQSIEIIFYLDFGVEPIFSSSIKKEELKIKSHVTTVIRNMWHVLESRSLI